MFCTLFKDKVKLRPESHQSPQIRSQKSVHTKTGKAHTDRDKCSERTTCTLDFIELDTIIIMLLILTQRYDLCVHVCVFSLYLYVIY